MANANRTIKAGPWRYTPQEFDQMCREATQRGDENLRSKPLATTVRYDQPSGHVFIKLNNGCTLTVPTRLLQGLSEAVPRELKQVRIMGPGLAIEWPSLDMQFTVAGLLAGVFGTQAWMKKIGHRPRKATSTARVRPARANGRGSQPGKTRVASTSPSGAN